MKSFLIFLLLSSVNTFCIAAGNYTIEIYKADRIMLLKKDHLLKKSYHIATGSGGAGTKIKLGDKMTPTGVYRILHFKEESRFHLFMQLNYPNAKDALIGLQKKTINQDEFKQIIRSLKRKTIPNQETDLGGAIGIHGIGEQTEDRLSLHKDENWTKGCVAIKNEEIEELRTFVKIGTPVVIFD